MKLQGTISVDIDTPANLYKGYNLRISKEYQAKELREGFCNLFNFLDDFNIKATLFCIGMDMKTKENQEVFREAHERGHEIANHTMTHAQALKSSSASDIEKEISECEQICQSITGERPIGFRAPGWNINEGILQVLTKRGYKYESSIFPTSLLPLLKFYWLIKPRKTRESRQAMGRAIYSLYPTQPYKTQRNSFKRGEDGLIEFPICVTPYYRCPFLATFLFYYGQTLSLKMLSAIQKKGAFLNFMFHIHDFVDYENKSPYFKNIKSGYIPRSVMTRYDVKIKLFRRILESMCNSYEFKTYRSHVYEDSYNIL